MSWEFHELCAVEGCGNVARSWHELTTAQKDGIREAYRDACLCDEHKALACGAWDEERFYICTRVRGHQGRHNGICYTWNGDELRRSWGAVEDDLEGAE